MRILNNRRGFSLVELLTVIAIIAILASIIFPVMSMVSNKARMNKCITQLHQIGLAVQMFKQDNRKYPDILGVEIMHSGGNIIPMDQPSPPASPRAVGLFPEYVKAARMYHCPNSKFLDPTTYIQASPAYDPLGDGQGIDAYSYNSYDFTIYGENDIRQHYTKSWAATPADVESQGPGAPSDPQRDYERQLKFKTPPDNTVITWCSWHEVYTGSGASLTVSGRAPVLFLDGHVDSLQAPEVEQYRWRTLPKKE